MFKLSDFYKKRKHSKCHIFICLLFFTFSTLINLKLWVFSIEFKNSSSGMKGTATVNTARNGLILFF